MAEQVIIPKLGMFSSAVTLTEWKVAEGGRIEAGETVLDIEAEKTTFEMPAPASGILHILAPQGAEMDVNTVVGLIAASQEEYDSLCGGGAPASSPAAPAAPAAAAPGMASVSHDEGGRRFSTPLARRLAREAGIDLAGVAGSGPNGRIQKRDVERASRQGTPAAAAPAASARAPAAVPAAAASPVAAAARAQPQAAPASAPSTNGRAIRGTIPYKGMRRSIGENMMRSLAVNAPNTMMGEFDFSAMVRARELLVARAERLAARITYSDLVLHAAAQALRAAPLINSSLVGDEIVIWDDINIGMAVGLGPNGDEGLLVPVIRNADRLSLVEISRKAKELADKARAGKLTGQDMGGGTFTVSNFGSLGVSSFSTPIINPPEAGIVAIGRMAKKPIVRNDGIVIAPVLPYSLTHDHRIVDGAAAEHFLHAFKKSIESPSPEVAELILA